VSSFAIEKMMYESVAKTDIGLVRACNEDSFVENTELGLWLVADGVGGNGYGDFASQVVSQTVERKLRLGRSLTQAIEDAHETVIKLGEDKPDIQGMATTVVAAHLKGRQYEICWVGDSRGYLISEQGIRQLTTDHNQAQHLFELGEISVDEIRTHASQRVLMHAVGVHDESWKIDKITGVLGAGEIILLCSDGLSGELGDDEILSVFLNNMTLEYTAESLIESALKQGGNDNITLILLGLTDQSQEQHKDKEGDQPLVDLKKVGAFKSSSKLSEVLMYIALGAVSALFLFFIVTLFIKGDS
jgi:serine/threonine protein phosphatase PrpC